jgi:hypothetical protein
MRGLIGLLPLFVLMACSETPDAPASQVEADITPQKQLDAEARSIEQAADEAVKLIEADAKADSDAAQESTNSDQ